MEKKSPKKGTAIIVVLILSFMLGGYASIMRCFTVEGFVRGNEVLITAYDGQKFSGKITGIGLFEITLSYMGRADVPVKRSEIRIIREY